MVSIHGAALAACTFIWALTTTDAFSPAVPSALSRTSPPTHQQQRIASSKRFASKETPTTNTPDPDHEIAMEKALKAMTAFSNKYTQNTKTFYCDDKSIPAVVIKGLAEHKVTLGAPLCPCRFYEDKEKEAKEGYWNCPCVPMRERHECHCMLFLTEDNDFAGEDTNISFEDVKKCSGGMMD